jgi:hypothetical protein
MPGNKPHRNKSPVTRFRQPVSTGFRSDPAFRRRAVFVYRDRLKALVLIST